jgi:hypothetical protein
MDPLLARTGFQDNFTKAFQVLDGVLRINWKTVFQRKGEKLIDTGFLVFPD